MLPRQIGQTRCGCCSRRALQSAHAILCPQGITTCVLGASSSRQMVQHCDGSANGCDGGVGELVGDGSITATLCASGSGTLAACWLVSCLRLVCGVRLLTLLMLTLPGTVMEVVAVRSSSVRLCVLLVWSTVRDGRCSVTELLMSGRARTMSSTYSSRSIRVMLSGNERLSALKLWLRDWRKLHSSTFQPRFTTTSTSSG